MYKRQVIIPSNLFLHTVPVKQSGESKYVTLAFHIDDNVKSNALRLPDIDMVSQLKFLGKPLSETVGPVSETRLFTEDVFGEVNYSLWYARLFTPKSSREAALTAALCLVNGGKVDFSMEESSEILSASEAMKRKDIRLMLDNVQQLYTAIRSDDVDSLP